MHRLLSALSLLLLLTTGCGDPSDGQKPPPDSQCRQQPGGVPQLGAPIVLSSALPRVMGSHLTAKGCTPATQGLADTSPAETLNGAALRGQSEDLYIPIAPVLTMDEQVESPARIIHVDAEGHAADFHVFSDAASNYGTGFFYESRTSESYKTGFYTGFGGPAGYYPLDAIFNLHLDASGDVYLEDNLANTLTLLPRQ